MNPILYAIGWKINARPFVDIDTSRNNAGPVCLLANSWCFMHRDAAEALLGENLSKVITPPVEVHAIESGCFGTAHVLDLHYGLATIQVMLEQQGLAPFCEIVWKDENNAAFQHHFGADFGPFERNLEMWKEQASAAFELRASARQHGLWPRP